MGEKSIALEFRMRFKPNEIGLSEIPVFNKHHEQTLKIEPT